MLTNPVIFWNNAALEANRFDHSDGREEQAGPTMSSRALALVHLAMHDAVVGITGSYPTYTSGVLTGAAVDADIAIAHAAHRALTRLFAKQASRFDADFLLYCSARGLDSRVGDTSPEAVYGRNVADEILRMRRHDMTAAGTYTPLAGQAGHRPDPANARQGFHGAAYGRNTLLACTQRFILNDPPKPGSPEYEADHIEVLHKGGAAALPTTTRSNDETITGLYWAYDGVERLGTPPRLYNLIVQAVLRDNAVDLTTDELVRLFALVNVAMGDSGVLAWQAKYDFEVPRPVIGIRDGEVAGVNNDFWLPLGAPRTNAPADKPTKPFTPPFPAYPSGHATFGAAAFQATRLFLKQVRPVDFTFADRGADGLAFDFVSEELDGVSTDDGVQRPRVERPYDSLWDAIRENGESRVYLGVHWRFDAFAKGDENVYAENVGGVPLGLNIAEDLIANGLTPSTV